ncbi:MAG: hypothetical protein HYY40_04625 [Bacteroidetes bacterium]|nr:hypothetical protein [Bacteroidota bacterium]
MPGRTFNPKESRYGFQGWEKTDEIVGNGNHYTEENKISELETRLTILEKQIASLQQQFTLLAQVK